MNDCAEYTIYQSRQSMSDRALATVPLSAIESPYIHPTTMTDGRGEFKESLWAKETQKGGMNHEEHDGHEAGCPCVRCMQASDRGQKPAYVSGPTHFA